MTDAIHIGLIDTPLERTIASNQIVRWEGGPETRATNFFSHSDVNVGLLIGNDQVAETPIIPTGTIYLADAVQETNLAFKLLEALEWIAKQPVNVVAMPFGEHHGSPFMIPMIRHLLDKDILPVAAIGNKGAGQFSAPGCYHGVLSVGSVDESGKVATYSGSLNLPDGKCLKPEVLTNGSVFVNNRHIQGTSFAATRLAGHLAVLRHKNPHVNYPYVINHVYSSCQPVQAGFKHRCEHGILNLNLLGRPFYHNDSISTKQMTISGKFTDPFLLRQIEQSPPHKTVDLIVCPKNTDLGAYPGIEVVKTFANDQIFAIKASVSTIRMMHTQPDILVLQSQQIPPLSILQLR